MTRYQNRLPKDLEFVKRISYPGAERPHENFFDAVVYLSYKGEICHDDDYGLVPSQTCGWFTELEPLDDKGLYRLTIKSLRMLDRAAGRPYPIKEKRYKELVGLPIADRPPLGPSKKIKLTVTKDVHGGPQAGTDIEVDVTIELPVARPGQPPGGKATNKDWIAGEEEFCPFLEHEDLSEIYGWAKYFHEYKMNIFCFNTRHPDIHLISRVKGQQKIIQEMFNVTNNGLQFHLEEASLAGELKSERLISKYGSMTNYILSQRFELFISGCIEKIKSRLS